MQIRRTTAAIMLSALILLAGFNVYQAYVIKAQRQIIVALYYDAVTYYRDAAVLAHQLQQCVLSK
jgi:hypothetical protein